MPPSRAFWGIPDPTPRGTFVPPCQTHSRRPLPRASDSLHPAQSHISLIHNLLLPLPPRPPLIPSPPPLPLLPPHSAANSVRPAQSHVSLFHNLLSPPSLPPCLSRVPRPSRLNWPRPPASWARSSSTRRWLCSRTLRRRSRASRRAQPPTWPSCTTWRARRNTRTRTASWRSTATGATGLAPGLQCRCCTTYG